MTFTEFVNNKLKYPNAQFLAFSKNHWAEIEKLAQQYAKDYCNGFNEWLKEAPYYLSNYDGRWRCLDGTHMTFEEVLAKYHESKQK